MAKRRINHKSGLVTHLQHTLDISMCRKDECFLLLVSSRFDRAVRSTVTNIRMLSDGSNDPNSSLPFMTSPVLSLLVDRGAKVAAPAPHAPRLNGWDVDGLLPARPGLYADLPCQSALPPADLHLGDCACARSPTPGGRGQTGEDKVRVNRRRPCDTKRPKNKARRSCA